MLSCTRTSLVAELQAGTMPRTMLCTTLFGATAHSLMGLMCSQPPACLVVHALQPIVQWGFIPAIIVAGMMFTKPRPTLGQLVLLG